MGPPPHPSLGWYRDLNQSGAQRPSVTRLYVQILPLPLSPALPAWSGAHKAETRQFIVPATPDATFIQVWRKIEARYKSNYKEGALDNWQFAKLTADLKNGSQWDIDVTDTVDELFPLGSDPDSHKITVHLAPLERELSVPFGSHLVVHDRKRQATEAQQVDSKRRRQEEEHYGAPLDTISPDHPLRSGEPDSGPQDDFPRFQRRVIKSLTPDPAEVVDSRLTSPLLQDSNQENTADNNTFVSPSIDKNTLQESQREKYVPAPPGLGPNRESREPGTPARTPARAPGNNSHGNRLASPLRTAGEPDVSPNHINQSQISTMQDSQGLPLPHEHPATTSASAQDARASRIAIEGATLSNSQADGHAASQTLGTNQSGSDPSLSKPSPTMQRPVKETVRASQVESTSHVAGTTPHASAQEITNATLTTATQDHIEDLPATFGDDGMEGLEYSKPQPDVLESSMQRPDVLKSAASSSISSSSAATAAQHDTTADHGPSKPVEDNSMELGSVDLTHVNDRPSSTDLLGQGPTIPDQNPRRRELGKIVHPVATSSTAPATQSLLAPLPTWSAIDERNIQVSIKNGLRAPEIRNKLFRHFTTPDVIRKCFQIRQQIYSQREMDRVGLYRAERVRLEDEKGQRSSTSTEKWQNSEDDIIFASRLAGLDMKRVANKYFPRRQHAEVTRRAQNLFQCARRQVKADLGIEDPTSEDIFHILTDALKRRLQPRLKIAYQDKVEFNNDRELEKQEKEDFILAEEEGRQRDDARRARVARTLAAENLRDARRRMEAEETETARLNRINLTSDADVRSRWDRQCLYADAAGLARPPFSKEQIADPSAVTLGALASLKNINDRADAASTYVTLKKRSIKDWVDSATPGGATPGPSSKNANARGSAQAGSEEAMDVDEYDLDLSPKASLFRKADPSSTSSKPSQVNKTQVQSKSTPAPGKKVVPVVEIPVVTDRERSSFASAFSGKGKSRAVAIDLTSEISHQSSKTTAATPQQKKGKAQTPSAAKSETAPPPTQRSHPGTNRAQTPSTVKAKATSAKAQENGVKTPVASKAKATPTAAAKKTPAKATATPAPRKTPVTATPKGAAAAEKAQSKETKADVGPEASPPSQRSPGKLKSPLTSPNQQLRKETQRAMNKRKASGSSDSLGRSKRIKTLTSDDGVMELGSSSDSESDSESESDSLVEEIGHGNATREDSDYETEESHYSGPSWELPNGVITRDIKKWHAHLAEEDRLAVLEHDRKCRADAWGFTDGPKPNKPQAATSGVPASTAPAAVGRDTASAQPSGILFKSTPNQPMFPGPFGKDTRVEDEEESADEEIHRYLDGLRPTAKQAAKPTYSPRSSPPELPQANLSENRFMQEPPSQSTLGSLRPPFPSSGKVPSEATNSQESQGKPNPNSAQGLLKRMQSPAAARPKPAQGPRPPAISASQPNMPLRGDHMATDTGSKSGAKSAKKPPLFSDPVAGAKTEDAPKQPAVEHVYSTPGFAELAAIGRAADDAKIGRIMAARNAERGRLHAIRRFKRRTRIPVSPHESDSPVEVESDSSSEESEGDCIASERGGRAGERT